MALERGSAPRRERGTAPNTHSTTGQDVGPKPTRVRLAEDAVELLAEADLVLVAADLVLVEALTVGTFSTADAAWHAVAMLAKVRRLVGAAVVTESVAA